MSQEQVLEPVESQEVVQPVEEQTTEPVAQAEDAQAQQETAQEEPKQEEQPKRRNRFQERINEKTREVYALRRELEELKQRVPVQETEEQQAQYQQQQRIQLTQREQFALEQKAQEARSLYQDFDVAVSKARNLNLSETIYKEIIDSEVGADILYELVKNPIAALDLSEMDSRRAIKEIARLEAEIIYEKDHKKAAASQPVQKQITKAPPPIKHIGGAAKVDIDEDKLSDAEYFARRRKAQLEKIKKG